MGEKLEPSIKCLHSFSQSGFPPPAPIRIHIQHPHCGQEHGLLSQDCSLLREALEGEDGESDGEFGRSL